MSTMLSRAQGNSPGSTYPVQLATVLAAGLSTNGAVGQEAQGLSQDLLDLSADPTNQALQSKVSTDFSSLAEGEGLSSADVNSIGEAASDLSPSQVQDLQNLANSPSQVQDFQKLINTAPTTQVHATGY